MTEVIARRGYHGPSNEEAIEAIHGELDALWDDASFVPDMDRMTFTTAVIEAAANIVQHALPVGEKPVEIGVDISVRPTRLVARVSAFNAREPFAEDMQPDMPDEDAESGRGPCAHRGLGDNRDLRTPGRHQHVDPDPQHLILAHIQRLFGRSSLTSHRFSGDPHAHPTGFRAILAHIPPVSGRSSLTSRNPGTRRGVFCPSPDMTQL
ncbi:hypothetical protein StoSoilB13_23620 [Arthrobacter sp. StoSoilB13]|nr:hypothetical protein [Arthrobacter sp. StoSoilB13]BCW50020.1 hypothetical protein StoSoilB13_23620 [Arthrobacter sp. StoSoilB13]